MFHFIFHLLQYAICNLFDFFFLILNFGYFIREQKKCAIRKAWSRYLKWGKLLKLHYSQVSIHVESVEDDQIIQALVLLLVNFKCIIKQQLIKKDVSLESGITSEEKSNLTVLTFHLVYLSMMAINYRPVTDNIQLQINFKIAFVLLKESSQTQQIWQKI